MERMGVLLHMKSDFWIGMLPKLAPVRMLWWGMFYEYRLLYFIVMTKNGMATAIAWRDSCKQKKGFLVDRTQKHGWEV